MGQLQAYKDAKALSQSSLKLLEYDPKSFYFNVERWLTGEIAEQPEQKITESMKLGSVLDCLITTPDRFDEEYVVNPADSPTGQMLKFVDEYVRIEKLATLDYTTQLSDEQIRKAAEQAYREAGFKRDKLDTVLERFQKEGLAYYNAQRRSKGKIVITAEMYAHAKALQQKLESDLYTASYLGKKPSDQTDVLYQVELYDTLAAGWPSVQIPCKGLIDILLINHVYRTVVPIDLKTTSDDNFQSAIVSYRYDLQGAFYTDLLHNWLPKSKYKDYEVAPFKFVVANTVNNKVSVWELTPSDTDVGKYGGWTHYGRRVSGYTSLLAAYAYHKQHNKWDYTHEVYMNNGLNRTNCFRNDD